jgi:hypothetical protein
MKIRTLFVITAIFFAINAPIALITPGTQLSLYGISPEPGANYMAQWAGLGSVVVALLAWFARDISDYQARRSIIVTLTVYFIIGSVISILGATSGLINLTGWILTIICLLFTVVYSYFLFKLQ